MLVRIDTHTATTMPIEPSTSPVPIKDLKPKPTFSGTKRLSGSKPQYKKVATSLRVIQTAEDIQSTHMVDADRAKEIFSTIKANPSSIMGSIGGQKTSPLVMKRLPNNKLSFDFSRLKSNGLTAIPQTGRLKSATSNSDSEPFSSSLYASSSSSSYSSSSSSSYSSSSSSSSSSSYGGY